MEKLTLDSFIEKLNLKQLKELQARIDKRSAELTESTPEIVAIQRIFNPRPKILIKDTTISDYILRRRLDTPREITRPTGCIPTREEAAGAYA